MVLRVIGEGGTPSLISRVWLEGATPPGGPAAGQGLHAFTWWADGLQFSLGTQDHEYLALRAERGMGVPARLALPLAEESPIDLLATGFQVRLPALESAEEMVLCYVVAWAADTPANDDASWFAVDIGTVLLADILKRAA